MSNKSKEISSISPQKQMDNLVDQFFRNKPYVKDITKNHELEVRFGTRKVKPITKIDYDNVIQKLKSFGFTTENEEGTYMLRMHNEILDNYTGRFKQSNIRTEICGFHGIKEYCKNNDLKKLVAENNPAYVIEFHKKGAFKIAEKEFTKPVDMDDFNFRVSYQLEERFQSTSFLVKNMMDNWIGSKKTYRYMNRATFTHPDIPVNVDISIVKSSGYANGRPVLTTTTEESNVFQNPEVYEIELEVDNQKIGPGTDFPTAKSLLLGIRKAIKYVLMGLQGTNYPISYPEQKNVLENYMKLVHGSEFNVEKRIYPSDFIGPSSYTLQVQNIVPVNLDTNIPNIRNNFTVTDKADGERHLLYINNEGRIYLINTNMKVIFTGTETQNKDVANSLVDGEIILHDKHGKFINLYASFDIYYLNGDDVRAYSFLPLTPTSSKKHDKQDKNRLTMLKGVVKELKPASVMKMELISPIRIDFKKFYSGTNIFSACNSILEKVDQGLFEYNTDGLIFTPAFMGVGSDEIGKAGKKTKITWEYSFKWKPPKYNTVDFLCTTVKNEKGLDKVSTVFEEGMDVRSRTQLNEYKTLELRCGFDEKKHGFLNPCQDVIDDKLPNTSSGNLDNEEGYRPVKFSPTNPADPNAAICHVMLNNGYMFSEEKELIVDNTIVECSYDLDAQPQWRWKPLRVRYDKTSELRQGLKNFGNAYHVANSNWHSIHNPITKEMISTGQDIPDELGDDDVYYNRVLSKNNTHALRDFHNLYVKKLLITSVSSKQGGDTLIDYACGKGGDFPKWIEAKLSFVFGIDYAKDNLENRVDGACARFLNYKKEFRKMPYALFVNGNSSVNIRSGAAMLNDKAIQITKAIFGQGARDKEKLGEGVVRQYGKGEDGFEISSCQFAIHYFFQSQNTFQNFLRNVAECTKLNGYFIGTSYDGKKIFQLLKKKNMGETDDLFDGKTKLWSVRKEYDEDEFEDDASCLGYQIDVYQESINKMFSEYLVNYDYLNRIMENYGFRLITREEAREMGLPEASGLFSELYTFMKDEMKRNPSIKYKVGNADKMTAHEKKISFLNRYFVYKKIAHVNAEKISLDLYDETVREKRRESKEKETSSREIEKPLVVVEKPKVKKLNRKLVLAEKDTPLEAEEAVIPVVEVPVVPVVPVVEVPVKPRKPRTKKIVAEEGEAEAMKPKAATKKMKLVLQE
jgi:hypothetical protein